MELTTVEEGCVDIGTTDRVVGPFDAVRYQYQTAISKQVRRQVRQKRDFFTKHEQAANRYYFDALAKIEAL